MFKFAFIPKLIRNLKKNKFLIRNLKKNFEKNISKFLGFENLYSDFTQDVTIT
jgi:hypothetical protein